jgi:hypothetical protein
MCLWFIQIEPNGKQLLHYTCDKCKVNIRFHKTIERPRVFCCGKVRKFPKLFIENPKKLLRRYAKN